MRSVALYIICLLFCSITCLAIGKKKKYDGPPRSEAELIARTLNCLQYADTFTYDALFPTTDTVWKQIVEYRATDQQQSEKIGYIRMHPEKVRQFDPFYNPLINKSFAYVEKKGSDSGIHWHDILLMRYELQKIKLTRDMVGYELVVPIRYKGFVFIKDMISRKDYVFAMNEVQMMNNFWYGGQVINIFEARSVDEYLAKDFAEMRLRKRMQELGITDEIAATDSLGNKVKQNEDEDEDESKKPQKEVADRKYYVGKFDNEIPVKLYIRYLKGNCPGGVCSWQAIYKFGDQDDYIKLDVEKKADSTWEFTEDPPIGGMDLKLKGKIYTGNWMGADNETGYDVRLTESDASPAKVKALDNIIENHLWAKDAPDKEKAKEEERGKDDGY
ncbi:MAG: hypothetical protein H0X33_07030 [Taibaiella sp.]|nr:hypothetical protein [Taibaiella sp.]